MDAREALFHCKAVVLDANNEEDLEIIEGLDEADALIDQRDKLLDEVKALVKAFGSLAAGQPGRWPEVEAAQKLIAEIENPHNTGCQECDNGGLSDCVHNYLPEGS